MPSGTRTTCPYCGVGCGIIATPREDGSVEIAGDPEHPANFGRLCSKGAALGETISLEGRLLHPIIDGARASWSEALDRIAATFSQTIADHGPDSVAFYVSGQLLTEDYYVANKLMKGFIGSGNIDTNSRLCMASSVAGHRRAFGADTVPGLYEDLELADLVVLVGSNLAWCHPVLFQRLMAAKAARGTKLVVIDPRETMTTEAADLHLRIASGADVALFGGLLAHLADTGALDTRFIEDHTNNWAEALAAARALDPAATTKIAAAQLAEFYTMFAAHKRVVTVYSQGVNQSSAGTDKVNAILNCHLATARIGKPGMGPFSVTGQPNAMGGREVGGLANMLAAHMEIENTAHRQRVQDFWLSPRIAEKPGLKAVDLFRAVQDGRIKALWIMGTNPVDSMPDADSVRAALRACPFVVVSDVESRTDTGLCADVLLPALAWGEKAGTVTNSERRISRQRAFLPAPGEAMADWRQICEVARRMNFGAAFVYEGPHEIFAEHAALTRLDNDGARDLDLGACDALDAAAYDALAPFSWPARSGETAQARRFFADGQFYHPDGRALFVATSYHAPASLRSARFPLWLNTGRIRDQWQTMTRTAKAARLTAHIGEPFVELHPDDAAAAGVGPADLIELESAQGRAVLRALITKRVRRGEAFAPMHWTEVFTSSGRINALTAGATDPISGQPELKLTPTRAQRWPALWHGFAVATRRPATAGADYFALACAKAGWRAELAGLTIPADWTNFARAVLGIDNAAELVTYRDAAGGRHGFLAVLEDRLAGALFVSPGPVACARDFLAARLGSPLSAQERFVLLAGRPGDETRDPGPTVCACFDIGRNAIVESGCGTVEEVGVRLKAGTNCGSCRAEIAHLVRREAMAGAD
jgi:assimilatory nitrate reductase catalytic subunit